MQPLIILLAAPSGTGKSTMAKRLFEDFPNLIFSISATTRPPREGESHGVDYYFLNMDEFQQKIDDKDFLEWEEFYGGTRYGTLRSELVKNTEKGYFTLLDVDVKGAVRIKSLFNERCLALYLRPPSLEILEERLRNRNTESESSLKLRIDRAEEELRYASHFDNIITNDDLEKAYSELKDVVQTFMNSY
jgi:guanylate kinase